VFLADRDQAMAVDEVQWHRQVRPRASAVSMLRKHVSERDLNPMAVTWGVAHLPIPVNR
jgi:hypothetical protein